MTKPIIMRSLFILLLVTMGFGSFAQSNLVFSLPKEYEIKVTINGYNSTKPLTWQVKFENIQQGTISATVVVTKPGSTKEERTFTLTIERGYEYTYFITPYKGGPECNLASIYTIEQVYGKNGDNIQPVNNDVRLNNYNGRPVLSLKDVDDFVSAAAQQKYGSDIIKWLKNQIPKFYFYTDDVVKLVTTLKYDSDKLELAKFAYDHTLDKHLYFKLAKSFQYSSTAEDLAKYVAGKG